jgi:hypothetical protein
MKRVLLMVIGLGLVAASAYVVALSLSGNDDDAVATVMPYPRALKPLPVPEVRIGQGHWQDPVTVPTPGLRPEQMPKFTQKTPLCDPDASEPPQSFCRLK